MTEIDGRVPYIGSVQNGRQQGLEFWQDEDNKLSLAASASETGWRGLSSIAVSNNCFLIIPPRDHSMLSSTRIRGMLPSSPLTAANLPIQTFEGCDKRTLRTHTSKVERGPM